MLNNELKGLLVVSLEQAVAAPYCSLLLADAGARVVKIERPEGDFARNYDTGAEGQSTIFAWLNRGKESICLDLKKPNELNLIKSMLRKSDIFISNLAPGAVVRMGLDGEKLREFNKGLICCIITGYGTTGAAKDKKAYDFLVQGEAGLCAVTGTEETPSRVGVSIADLSTGLTAFSAILRALIQRGKNGRGFDVNISMFDVMADWMNMPLLVHRYMGSAPRRTGLQHSFIAPYGAFTCKGGKKVLLSIQNNREWAVFCEKILQMPELIADNRFINNPERYANRVVLDAFVNDVFKRFEPWVIIENLENAGIANGVLSSVADLSDHVSLKNSEASFDSFNVSVAALPVKSQNNGPTLVPALGQHTEALWQEFADLT